MQEGAHQDDAAPMDLERPLHCRREEEIDQLKGLRRGCLCDYVICSDEMKPIIPPKASFVLKKRFAYSHHLFEVK